MGKCHFNNSWLQQKDSNDIVVSCLAKQVNDENILCCVCDKKIQSLEVFRQSSNIPKARGINDCFS